MKTLLVLLVTTLATAPFIAQTSGDRQWDAAQALKPAHLTSTERIAPATEPGTPLIIDGVELDPSGKPAAAVEVFAYHTDRAGLYSQPGAADPWRLQGGGGRDAHGRFEFHTIRPAAYPNRPIPAHVHLTLTSA